MPRAIENLKQGVRGERAGSITAVPLVAAATFARWVKVKAKKDNAGVVAVGGSDVTLPDGVTDATAGMELAAGQETDWKPVPNKNLQNVFIICTNATDDCQYDSLL